MASDDDFRIVGRAIAAAIAARRVIFREQAGRSPAPGSDLPGPRAAYVPADAPGDPVDDGPWIRAVTEAYGDGVVAVAIRERRHLVQRLRLRHAPPSSTADPAADAPRD